MSGSLIPEHERLRAALAAHKQATAELNAALNEAMPSVLCHPGIESYSVYVRVNAKVGGTDLDMVLTPEAVEQLVVRFRRIAP
jgi:hypothetical protein